MNNGGLMGGSSDQAFVQPVVNAVPVTIDAVDDVAASYLEGGQPTPISGTWLVDLASSGTTTVRFRVWSYSGHQVGCLPNEGTLPFLKTRVRVTGVVVQ
jgi:hypothetical protein